MFSPLTFLLIFQAEVRLWTLRSAGLGSGGPAFCYLFVISQWSQSLPGQYITQEHLYTAHYWCIFQSSISATVSTFFHTNFIIISQEVPNSLDCLALIVGYCLLVFIHCALKILSEIKPLQLPQTIINYLLVRLPSRSKTSQTSQPIPEDKDQAKCRAMMLNHCLMDVLFLFLRMLWFTFYHIITVLFS